MSFSSVSYEFAADSIGGAEWRVHAFHLSEQLTRPYMLDVTVDLLSEQDAAGLLGSACTFTMKRGGETREVHGICSKYEELDHEETMLPRVRVLIGPALVALHHRRDARIFQDMTVPEIIEQVLTEGLADYQRSVRSELSASYQKREYCVQYHETDLSFVDRLMQQEGIGYFFDQSGAAEVVVLVDGNSTFSNHGEKRTVHLIRNSSDEESLSEFTASQQSRATQVTVHAFDWSRPANPLTNKEGAADSRSRTRELFVPIGSAAGLYQGSGYTKDNTKQHAQVLLEAEQMSQWEGTGGAGSVTGFSAGTVFKLQGQGKSAHDQDYIVIAVSHAGFNSHTDPGKSGLAAPAYQNTFECIPLAVPYRPRLGCQPCVIPGLQTATVVGPEGEEVHTDEHGRVKVKFHWDRKAKGDDTSSCWIRVNQSWAGAGFGSVFVPRIGMEVTVGFLDGNPDNPLVLGCHYNGAKLAAYNTKDKKTKTVLRTRSSPKGDGYNELSFEDAKGEELAYLRAERDMKVEVINDKATEIGGNETLDVTKNRTRTIGGDQILAVKGDDTMTVSKNQSLSVSGTRTENITKSLSLSVGKTSDTTVTGNCSITLESNHNLTVTKNMTESVEGARRLEVTKNFNVQVTENFEQQVTKALTAQADTMQSVCKTSYVLQQGDASITLKNGEVHIKASKIKLNGTDINLVASGKMVIKGSTATID